MEKNKIKNLQIFSYSVVIPVYKTIMFMDRLTDSIMNASNHTIFDVIFIDDQGNDELEWSKYINKLKKCNVISTVTLIKNKKNRGVTYSRNRGYLFSNSKYIIFMDSDDLFKPNAIDNIDNIFRKNLHIDVALFSTQYTSNHQFESKGIKGLLQDYNKGERTVVVKKNKKSLPFCGFLRGHETYGLLKFLCKTKGNFKTFDLIVRDYRKDNINSLSLPENVHKRHKFIILGHLKSSKILFIQKFYFSSIQFFLRGIISYLIYILK
jgi:glycosyltransferase involved in cell wall biosynthesis